MAKRICVIGAGRWGSNHIRTLAELGHLGGFAESDATRLAECRDRHPGVPCFDDHSAAIRAGFDGYVVATPAHTHADIAAEILRQDRPVLVEKPLALNVADARRLRDLAHDRGVPLMVGHIMLFHPAVRKIRELIQSGKIGKLQYLYSNRLNLGAVRTEENILWSFAPHDIAMFQHLIGRPPGSVVSHGGVFLQPDIHDTTITVLTYPDNIVGHIFLSWLHPFKEHRVVIIGSKGMLSYEDSSDAKQILFYEKGIDWFQGEPVKRDGPTDVIPHDRAKPLAEELRYFIDHLDAGRIDLAGPDSAVEVLEILELATASLLHPRDAGSTVNRSTPNGDSDCLVHPSSFVDDDVQIGEGTRIWHFSHVQRGARLGRHCTLGQNVSIGENVIIGNHVKIQNNVSVYNGVELQDYVFCGPSMVFTNIPDPRSKYPQRGPEHNRRTLVGLGASLGANATILCGITIGRHAMIGAGAVVTKDVPDYALMIGVPARRSGWVCECGQVLPDFDRQVACPRCGIEYAAGGDGIARSDGPAHPNA